MNYCSNCGNKIDENLDVCLNCGVRLKVTNYGDKGGFIWGILGFFVPLAGLILFLSWRNEKPKTAKSVGIGTLISVSLNIVMLIIVIALAFISGVNDIYDYNDFDYRDDYYYNFE